MKSFHSLLLTMFLFTAAVLMMSPASAQTFSTLYAFTGTGNGEYPAGHLVVGPNGDLYGTAPYNTEPFQGRGVVFRITPGGQETVIDNFSTNKHDGKNPRQGLIADKAGNLYGTTEAGGEYFYGTLFKLTPPQPGSKKWTEEILHSFDRSVDGAAPYGLIMDAAGNLYGFAVDGQGDQTDFLYQAE